MSKLMRHMITGELAERFREVDGCVFVNFSGLNAELTVNLRQILREKNLQFTVIKNSLFGHAIQKVDGPSLREMLKGPIGVAYGEGGAVNATKTLTDWMKKNRKLEFKGGILSGKIIGSADVEELANIPEREVLLAMVAGTFAAPMRGLATIFAGVIRSLLYALKAVEEKRGGGEEAPAA